MLATILFGLVFVMVLALIFAYTPVTERCNFLDPDEEYPPEDDTITTEVVLEKGLTPAMIPDYTDEEEEAWRSFIEHPVTGVVSSVENMRVVREERG